MKNIILIAVILALLIMAVIPATVSATVDLPDISFIVSSVNVYQSALEVYDQLYIYRFDIAYTDPLDAPDLVSEYYIIRLMDGGVTIGTIRPWGVFDASGECNWFGELYISSATLTALGYDPPTDFGAATGWDLVFDGDPVIDWTGGVPPSTSVAAADMDWNDSVSMSETSTLLTTDLRALGVVLETETGIDLMTVSSGKIIMTETGQTYFTSTVSALYTLCPDLFASVIEAADFEDKDYVKDYYLTGDNDAANVYGVNWIAQTWTPSATYTLSGVELMAYKLGNPGTLTVSLRATVAGVPSGADLATGTINADNFATYTKGNYYSIAFTTDYDISSGTVYAFVIRALAGDVNNYVGIRLNNAGTYTGGKEYTSANSGVAWNNVDANDLIWRAISRDIINDAYAVKLENKQAGRFDSLSDDWGISAMWIGFLLWTFVIGLVGWISREFAQDYVIVLPLAIIMYPIGGFIGFVSWALCIVMMLILSAISLYYFTRGMPG